MKYHKLFIKEKTVKRRFKLILMSALISVFVSLLAVFMIKAVNSGISALWSPALVVPVILLIISASGVYEFSERLKNPLVTISGDEVKLRRRFPFNFGKTAVSITLSTADKIGIQRFGGRLNLVFIKNEKVIVYPIIYAGSIKFLRDLTNELKRNAENKDRNQLLQELKIIIEALDSSSEHENFEQSFILNFPHLAVSALYKKLKSGDEITCEDLKKLYICERSRLHEVKLYSRALQFSGKLPDFTLPKEDMLRISAVFRWKDKIKDLAKELKDSAPEEISKDNLEKWTTGLKYGNLPEVPHSGMMSKLMAGAGISIEVESDGTIKTKEGNAKTEYYVLAEIVRSTGGIREIFLHDIGGRKFSFNRDTLETLCKLKAAAPHILITEFSHDFVPGFEFKIRKLLKTACKD